MKIIALTLLAITMASFPALIKAPGGGGRGGGFTGGGPIIGGGFIGGGQIPKPEPSTGFKGGTNEPPKGESSGFLGGKPDKPQPGGDTGPAIIVVPKPGGKPGETIPASQITWPAECKPGIRHCATKYVYERGNGLPRQGGTCCGNFRAAMPCLCRLLTAKDPMLSKEANRVLRGCRIPRPVCIKVAMPPQCRPEVKHCINYHILGGGEIPPYHGACCNKFKTSKSCMCNFHTSNNPKLRRAADGILQGCHFKRPRC